MSARRIGSGSWMTWEFFYEWSGGAVVRNAAPYLDGLVAS